VEEKIDSLESMLSLVERQKLEAKQATEELFTYEH
jgi:hypothetical protein